MLNIYFFINIIIYSSVLSFFIPFASKSISFCEISIITFGALILIQNYFRNIHLNKFEFLFMLFSLSKLSFKNLNFTLRSLSAALFIGSLNLYKYNQKMINIISNTSFNIILITTFGAFINSILGNSLWARFLLFMNLLPQSVNEIQIQTWWNNENGIISFFVTQNMLAQFIFIIFILIDILKSQNYISNRKFFISISCIGYLLYMTKTSLGFFGLILLGIYLAKNYLINFINLTKKNILEGKIKLNHIFIIIFLSLVFLIFASERNLIFNQLNNGKMFLESILYFDKMTISEDFLDTSEFNRFYYSKIFFENLDKCALIGESSFLSETQHTPHNFYLSIAHYQGLLPLVIYLSFLASLFFNKIRIKEINSSYKLLFLYLLIGGFQGDFFSDSRSLLPLLLILFIGDSKKLNN